MKLHHILLPVGIALTGVISLVTEPLMAVGITSLIMASCTGLFFAATRGTLLVRAANGESSAASHVYPVYSNKRLIGLVDFQPVIAAILLFQYSKLVSLICDAMDRQNLGGKDVLSLARKETQWPASSGPATPATT